jgi:hypothetical protein
VRVGVPSRSPRSELAGTARLTCGSLALGAWGRLCARRLLFSVGMTWDAPASTGAAGFHRRDVGRVCGDRKNVFSHGSSSFRSVNSQCAGRVNPSRFRLRISLPATSQITRRPALLLGASAFTRSSEAPGGCQEICDQLLDVYGV